MKRTEFETIKEVRNHLQGSSDLSHAVFQSINLSEITEDLRAARLQHNVLLGCSANPETLALFESPVILPSLNGASFKPFRSSLYTPEELLGGYTIGDPDAHSKTLDGRCYSEYVTQGKAQADDVVVTLLRRLHDHGITDALQEFIQGRNVVAIMGGHSMPRSLGTYLNVARLARDLRNAGFLTISGGGPGAMEATHVGAWFAERDDSELQEAVQMLSMAPGYDPINQWMDAAFKVIEKFPLTSETACESLGIPTWLYGHEPPTPFATKIAKYFANSVREEGLLAIANCGVVFTPGSEGTIQEVFQDAAQNRYKTFEHASPMVFFGEDFWKYRKPVYPLLAQLSAASDYGKLISITDESASVLHTMSEFAKTLGT
ncbi:MAG: hypothetical protein AB8G99_12485 [Planctomycetaceae bacterium]